LADQDRDREFGTHTLSAATYLEENRVERVS
jgi:hypothetical protein